jgi:hypothetical protein
MKHSNSLFTYNIQNSLIYAETAMNNDLQNVEQWLKANRMIANIKKTKTMERYDPNWRDDFFVTGALYTYYILGRQVAFFLHRFSFGKFVFSIASEYIF